MTVTMPPRMDGMINVTHGEVEDARMATEDVELVRADGTLTEAGQIYVASVRRLTREEFDPEFDHVYLIDGLGMVTDNAHNVYAPDVINDSEHDVLIDYLRVEDSEWSVLTGHTGQQSYNGAVMHPSEQWGKWAINDLASRTEEDGHVAFCIVEVRDDEGDYPEGDPIGWAVAYKVVH